MKTITTVATIGLDIAKNSFSVHGFDDAGHTVLTKDLKRGQVLAFFARLESSRAGAAAAYLTRRLSAVELVRSARVRGASATLSRGRCAAARSARTQGYCRTRGQG